MRDLYIWGILLHWIFRSIPRQFILNQFDKGLFYEGWMDIVWASFLHRINKMQDLTQEQELTVSFDSPKPYHKSLCPMSVCSKTFLSFNLSGLDTKRVQKSNEFLCRCENVWRTWRPVFSSSWDQTNILFSHFYDNSP